MKQIVLLFILGSFAFIGSAQGQITPSASTSDKFVTGNTFPKPGEWPSFRRSGTLEAHSPLRGNISRLPVIAWKQFVGALESRIVVEPSSGNVKLSLPDDETKSPASDSIALADFIPRPRNPEEDNSSLTSTYADVLPEYHGKEKLEFESAFDKAMKNGQWAESAGICYAMKNGEWVEVWKTVMPDLFNPLPLVGDFDGDGSKEIAILPFYQLKLLDAQTGKVKDSCRFNENRSYGFHGIYDFNGDGKIEFLVQADFSKHVDVLGFRDGELSLLWQQDIEQDIAHPQKILRVAPNPTADVDGDGHPEVITTLFNDAGDERWHLTFRDGMTGKIKADFPNEYLAAPLDLDNDGVMEILTTCTDGVGTLSKIRVRSLKGQSRILWEKNNATWQTWNPPLPVNVKSMATLGDQTVLSQNRNKAVYVILNEGSREHSILSLSQWDGMGFKPITTISGESLEVLGFDATGRILVRSRHQIGRQSSLSISNGKVIRQTTKRLGMETGPAIVAWPETAKSPTIVVQGAVHEQIAFQPPNEDGAKVKLTHINGRGQGTWYPRTLGPVVADLAGDGRRQIIVAGAAPSGCARLSVKDLDGKIIWQHDFPKIAGTPPPANTGGVVLWQTGHFTDTRRQDVLVTTQRSKMHSEETFLLSGVDGHEIWHREKQISKRAVGGNSFAVADYDGDGLDDLASLWPSILYLMKGNTGQDILAMDATWKQVYAKQVYFGHAVAGNFLNEGKPALFFSGRLMTGVIKLDGTLVWFDALDKSPAYLPSFGDFDGDKRTDVIGIGYEDGVRCYDMASGKVKWTIPNPTDGFGEFGSRSNHPVRGTASADLDGDGRDEALVCIDKTLFCLGSSTDGSKGEIRWKVELPVLIGPPTIVTLDKANDGQVSILVVGNDGYVYCLR
jgi:hypothetical protein